MCKETCTVRYSLLTQHVIWGLSRRICQSVSAAFLLSHWVLTLCCVWMFDASDTLTKWIPYKSQSGRAPLCHKVLGCQCHCSRLGWDCTNAKERELSWLWFLWHCGGGDVVTRWRVNCWCHYEVRNHRKALILVYYVNRKTEVDKPASEENKKTLDTRQKDQSGVSEGNNYKLFVFYWIHPRRICSCCVWWLKWVDRKLFNYNFDKVSNLLRKNGKHLMSPASQMWVCFCKLNIFWNVNETKQVN